MGFQETLSSSGGSSPLESHANGSLEKTAVKFARQSEKLSHLYPENGSDEDIAVEARFVTPYDPVIVTSDGNRLPTVPLEEAHKLNVLKKELEASEVEPVSTAIKTRRDSWESGEHAIDSLKERVVGLSDGETKDARKASEGSLRRSMPPTHTNPLFPPLPLYGPPSLLRHVQCLAFRVSSFFLSLSFLGVIVLGALFTSIGPSLAELWQKARSQDPDTKRPFYSEELRRAEERRKQEAEWQKGNVRNRNDEFTPTEGGPDPLVCDVAYYARRVGLDIEEFQVQTEDGFIIDLWHVYDPKEHTRLPAEERAHRSPELFTEPRRRPDSSVHGQHKEKKPKFPVLLMHGLLQSSGAYCVNDDASLAFYLCKSGYDVWLGNNRCGFTPKHSVLSYGDPRMWAWNIRQMGVFDLPALTSRVRYETGFDKIGLICHSQGTTQTFVALAKEQCPELGEKLTVFCALAPAAYAGPLIGKMYFKFMRVISPAMFRLMFGIHAFIPFMMDMHRRLPPKLYGWMGYKVFWFLFNWTDTRWDRALRDRMFQFAPVYVSSESMRWWLGRECFARHKCILATQEEWRAEEREDRDREAKKDAAAVEERQNKRKPKGSTAWYNEKAPPFALWIAGNDDLVDGKTLLRRFQRGREPHVEVVHSKIIPEYEHLDVIWAMDAVDQVFKEVREVLWKTCNVRDVCRVPKGCEDVSEWKSKKGDEKQQDEAELGSQSSSEDLSS